MKDRVIQGFIAGIVGWLPTFIFSMTVYTGFHLTRIRFMDFGGVLAFSHRPHGFVEALFSESIVLFHMAGLGILYAMVMNVIANPHPLLKGGIFGGLSWFIIYTVVNVFRVKGIYGVTDFETAVLNLIGSIIWGITLGGAFSFLTQKHGEE
ncbi:MAG: DUF6789 family protein [Bacteroidota bacterium]